MEGSFRVEAEDLQGEHHGLCEEVSRGQVWSSRFSADCFRDSAFICVSVCAKVSRSAGVQVCVCVPLCVCVCFSLWVSLCVCVVLSL